MSHPNAILPLPDDVAKYRNLLFNLDGSVILDATQFQSYWPLVDNIYSHRRSYTTSTGKKTMYYECRLVKSRPFTYLRGNIAQFYYK